MKRVVLLSLAATFALTITFITAVDEAHAIPQFKKEFDAKYVDEDSDDPVKIEFAEKVKEAKCNVCHFGKKKKDRNSYGNALAELLDKKEDKENKEKIQESLDKVAGMKTNPEDENSPTYGELFNSGDLPEDKVAPAE